MSNRKRKPDETKAPHELRSYVDRLVSLEERKREIQEDINTVKNEAKSDGFDKRVLSQMVKETMMSAEQRLAQHEFEEICEVYRANLGMLSGTPLGDAARKRAADRAKPPADEGETSEREDKGTEGVDTPASDDPLEETMPPEDIETARENGREAGRTGIRIFANPYVAGDPRRASWDEGHCEATGTDGMEIPSSWRRRPKRQAGAGDEGRAS